MRMFENPGAMSRCIAKRELTYSVLGSRERKPLVIRIFEPVVVAEGAVDFCTDDGVTGCRWEIEGLPEEISDTAYGIDSIQALHLAIDIDAVLRCLRNKYDFYFPSGEPCFED